jgi:hypothetical protein
MSVPIANPGLLIDDIEVDLGNIWIHSQDDPYPGGYRYRLWLPEPLSGSWVSAGRGLDGLASVVASWRW